MFKRSILRMAGVTAAACALVLARGDMSLAQTPTKVTAAVIGISVSIWPAVVAKEKGFFAEQGLDVDMVSAGSSSRSLQQVAAGVAQIGSSSMVDSVRAIGAGAEVKVFINSLAVGTHSMVAAKTIKSVKELKGKRVMTGGQGDITNLWWKAMARHYGLDPEKDVELLFSGSTSNRMAALFAGGIDATVLSTPQSFQAIDQGWTDLGPVAPYLGEFPMMIWHVNMDWARSHEKILLGFVRAHNKAVAYMTDPAHRQEVSEMLARISNSSVNDALKTWDICMQIKAFVPDGGISDATIERVRDTLLTSGDLKGPVQPTNTYYDAQYVGTVAK